MCAFKSAQFPDSLAIAIGHELTVWTIKDIPKFHIQSMYINEEVWCIAHQKQSHTFCICSVKSAESTESSFVHLIDDQTFAFVSKYRLGQKQYGCSVLNCSFSDAYQDYYCVGTSKGQTHILIFKVEGRELKLVAQFPLDKADSSVLSLHSFQGRLLAVISDHIRLFKGVLIDDGKMRLEQECSFCVRGLGKKLLESRTFKGDNLIASLFQLGTNRSEDILKNMDIPVEEFKKKVGWN